ncbi:hypothetical protein [Streptomyces sp. SID3343]|uniref:hypothetical protein n=1 Tax=Streptomyces sp. SID3343 TaxID=2690260 RepID=UPI00136DD15A|nr:hypothetical protein [Streptomyces sp. SID3343]MYW04239.1 hypothetical protein [Streptomyces sp. SID3343]
MTETTTATPETPGNADARVERQVRRISKHIRRFTDAHGGGGDAVVEFVGRDATRIVIVAGDGMWADQVVRSPDIARLAVAQAGLTLHEEFPNDLAAKVKTTKYEWSRMAGLQLGGSPG